MDCIFTNSARASLEGRANGALRLIRERTPLRNILPRYRTEDSLACRTLGCHTRCTDAAFYSACGLDAAIEMLALNEENMILNGDDTKVEPPFGDGHLPWSYSGLIQQARENSPREQVRCDLGELTAAHLQEQVNRLEARGARGVYMVASIADETCIGEAACEGG